MTCMFMKIVNKVYQNDKNIPKNLQKVQKIPFFLLNEPKITKMLQFHDKLSLSVHLHLPMILGTALVSVVLKFFPMNITSKLKLMASVPASYCNVSKEWTGRNVLNPCSLMVNQGLSNSNLLPSLANCTVRVLYCTVLS